MSPSHISNSQLQALTTGSRLEYRAGSGDTAVTALAVAQEVTLGAQVKIKLTKIVSKGKDCKCKSGDVFKAHQAQLFTRR